MKKIKRSNTNYSIKPRFQVRLFLKVASIVLVSIAVTGMVFYFYSNREITDSFKLFHINARNFLDYLVPAILTSMLGGLFIAAVMTYFFPHPIAGPLFRIERDIKERIGSGDLTVRFNLRKGDELGELAENLNIALEKLSLIIKDMKSISDDLSKIMSANKNPDKEELKEIHERLNGIIQKFKI
jgi:methyl-accepting chemotaxis protein